MSTSSLGIRGRPTEQNFRKVRYRQRALRSEIYRVLSPSFPLHLPPDNQMPALNILLGKFSSLADELGSCFDFILGKASGMEQPTQKLSQGTE